MKMLVLPLALFALLLAGCSSGGGSAGGADGSVEDAAVAIDGAAPADGGDVVAPADVSDDVSDDAFDDVAPDIAAPDIAADATGDPDTSGDTEADAPEPLVVPNEPAPPAPEVVLRDEPFVQEVNHTVNEQPPGVGALVGLVLPPDGYDGFARPTLVAPRGLWRPDGEDGLVLLGLPDGAADVVDAEASGGAIWLLTADAVLRVAADGTFDAPVALPDGAVAWRLAPAEGGVYALTSAALGWLPTDGEAAWTALDPAPSALLRTSDALVLAWSDALVGFGLADDGGSPGAELWRVDLAVGAPVAVLADRTLPQALDLVVVGSEGLAGFALSDDGASPVDVPLFAEGRVPLAGAVAAREDTNGGLVVAAVGGAYRVVDEEADPEWGLEYRVYVADRWMPSGDVRDVLADGTGADGGLWFATGAGLGWVTRFAWTLEDKTAPMIERIVLRHDRDGAIADSRMTTVGDFSTNIPWDSDNDGGWTCYWVLSECFRWKLTGAPDAKANFDRSLARMLSLRTLTGTDWFLARSVIRIEGCQLDDCDGPDDGEWFLSPDGEWWVKADTSNDEVTSHMFMMGHAYDVCADDEQKAAIVAHVDGIVGGLVDNGYQLIDPQDGKTTTHGQFDPFYVNTWFAGVFADGGRRSAQMLGALNLAIYLTGDEKYRAAKRELIDEHHYDINVTNVGDASIYGFCAGSGDCDELAFQGFVPLLRYETDPALREKWMIGWRQLYAHLVDQEDALWDVTNAVVEGDGVDLFATGRWYRRYPTDLVRWVVRNGVRTDAVPPPPYYLEQDSNADYRLRSDGHVFPPDERPNERHNAPQFKFQGGHGGHIEMDGGDALFPYWFGRFYGFIAAP